MLVEGEEQLGPCTPLVRKHGTGTSENSWAVSYKVKCALTVWPTNPLLGAYQRETRAYTETHTWSSLVHNHPKLETAQMPTGEQWNSGTCTGGRREQYGLIHPRHLGRRKKPVSTVTLVYGSICVAFWTRWSCGTENTSVIAEAWGESRGWLWRGQGHPLTQLWWFLYNCAHLSDC